VKAIAKITLKRQLKHMKKVANSEVKENKKQKKLTIAKIFADASTRSLIAVSKAKIEKPLLAGLKRETKEFAGMKDIYDEISRFFITEDNVISTFFDQSLLGKDMIVSGSFPGKKLILFDQKSHEWDYDALIRMDRCAILNSEIDWIDYRPVGLSKLALNVKDVQASDIRLLLVGVVVQFRDGTRKHFWMTLQALALRVSD